MIRNLKLRPPKQEDKGFIVKNWLGSFRTSDWAKKLHKEVYFPEHRKLVENCFDRGDGSVICNTDDEDHLFGYVMHESKNKVFCIHYIYIKPHYRGFGMAAQVLKDIIPEDLDFIFYSHATSLGEKLLYKFKSAIYDPYLFLSEGEEWKK